MKRVLVQGLSLVVLVAVLSACTPVALQPGEGTPAPTGPKDRIIFSALGDATQIFDHPWYQAVQEYNAAHPEVDIVVVGGLSFDALATMILAGNAPDLIHGAISPLFARVPEMPNSVDITPWLTEEDFADYGPAIEALRNPSIPEQIVGFPVDLQVYPQLCANIDVLEAEGVDWQRISAEGWTWDEFITTLQQLTTDANGRHPNEEGFDPANIEVWGWATGGEALAEQIFLAMMNNGLPGYAGFNVGAMGSVWDLTGPRAVEAAQFVYDWLYTYRITDPAFRAWGESQRLLRLQMQAEGDVVFTNEYGCATALERYNTAVENGEIAGTVLETRFRHLPLPYNPDNMSSEVYSILPIHIQVMKQEPYKGDQHTENVIAFAKWFVSAETQIHICRDISASACTVPARASVREAIITDPEQRARLEYMVARAKANPAMIHPAQPTIDAQVKLPAADRLLSNEITPEQFVDEVTTGAQAMLDDWVNDAGEADRPMVQLWCTIPDWYPGEFYPNYEAPVSEACRAKLQELGIE